jgi:hypothetical protein
MGYRVLFFVVHRIPPRRQRIKKTYDLLVYNILIRDTSRRQDNHERWWDADSS